MSAPAQWVSQSAGGTTVGDTPAGFHWTVPNCGNPLWHTHRKPGQFKTASPRPQSKGLRPTCSLLCWAPHHPLELKTSPTTCMPCCQDGPPTIWSPQLAAPHVAVQMTPPLHLRLLPLPNQLAMQQQPVVPQPPTAPPQSPVSTCSPPWPSLTYTPPTSPWPHLFCPHLHPPHTHTHMHMHTHTHAHKCPSPPPRHTSQYQFP